MSTAAAKQVKKASLRSRRRRVEVLATSSVLTDKLLKKASDEQLAQRFGHSVGRIKQVRYAIGFFRKARVTEQEVKTIVRLSKQRISLRVIGAAMNRDRKTVYSVLQNNGMKSQGRITPSREEKQRVNKVLQAAGLPAFY